MAKRPLSKRLRATYNQRKSQIDYKLIQSSFIKPIFRASLVRSSIEDYMYSSIDRIDYAILDVLAVDGRASISTIADRAGLSKTPCQTRLKTLQQLG